MINITENICVAWDPASFAADLPAATVVPFGDSLTERNKIKKLTSKYQTVTEYSNVPIPGFTIVTANRRTWGASNQTWVVVDPRGFTARITSANLEKILRFSGITEGLIQEQCIWVRQNTETTMSLMPISSPSYTEAVDNTSLLVEKVPMSGVEIGDTVLTKTKCQGVYLGVMSLYGNFVRNSSGSLSSESLLRRQVVEASPGVYYYRSNLEILKVVKAADSPMTKAQAVDRVRDQIASGRAYFTCYQSAIATLPLYGKTPNIKHVSLHPVKTPTLSLVELTKEDAKRAIKDAVSADETGSSSILFADSAGIGYLLYLPPDYNPGRSISLNSLSVVGLGPEIFTSATVVPAHSPYYSRLNPTYSFDSFTKFYMIIKHINNETYY